MPKEGSGVDIERGVTRRHEKTTSSLLSSSPSTQPPEPEPRPLPAWQLIIIADNALGQTRTAAETFGFVNRADTADMNVYDVQRMGHSVHPAFFRPTNVGTPATPPTTAAVITPPAWVSLRRSDGTNKHKCPPCKRRKQRGACIGCPPCTKCEERGMTSEECAGLVTPRPWALIRKEQKERERRRNELEAQRKSGGVNSNDGLRAN